MIHTVSHANNGQNDGEVHQDAELVDAYWEHYRRTWSGAGMAIDEDQDDWPWEEVDDRVQGRADGVVSLLIALADAVAGNELALAYLGAGPIEDFLRGEDPASPLLDELDAAARTNENVRTAVRCVWWSGDDHPSVVARFTRFGPPL
jgi:hypothetical protein